LFAGVASGAAEVRKFLERGAVNRVILLSDGQAYIGPSSPMELADLGRSLGKESISVSTLGVGPGYNEDLMMQLAAASSGNHVFVEVEASLVAIFNREFDWLRRCEMPEKSKKPKVYLTSTASNLKDIAMPARPRMSPSLFQCCSATSAKTRCKRQKSETI